MTVYNGVSLSPGQLPATTVPAWAAARSIDMLRIPLDPRNLPTLTDLVDIADAAETAGVGVVWAMAGCTEPVDATTSQRPSETWLEGFWEDVLDQVGDHAATYGIALLGTVTLAETGAATATDPVEWGPNSNQDTAVEWLEDLMDAVTTHVRAYGTGFAGEVFVPLMYGEESRHTAPWIVDSNIIYEATVYPTLTDSGDAFTELVYFSEALSGVGTILPADLLPMPPLGDLGLDPNDLDDIYPPTAPVLLGVTEGDGGISATWDVPSWDGGAPISEYRLVVDGTVFPVHPDYLATTILGLENDVAVDVYVVAVNDGDEVSEPSNVVSATPSSSGDPLAPPAPEPPTPETPPVPIQANFLAFDKYTTIIPRYYLPRVEAYYA